ncbi:MAG TPA: butyrate kinase [Candidatus Hydrothermia bacterium]|nr:butyrate kinase [Candidatus Hydrothermia bacterium]MDD5573020.1 butyrate kinase [Candidatus Hydrothermia bacterium]HOK22907.1 butyrate kinase [Candidatus Hydrothermia bacterium]HOL23616.1 butyrate kinase [Candidatus Hydrothermia bacterium]HPO78622.1 butyrate kinase [Candidatus Hydrothermia bacterium]
MSIKIFVVNPGGGSTRVALFEDENLLKYEELRHNIDELKKFPDIISQKDFRYQEVLKFIDKEKINEIGIDAIAARGGTFKSLESGVYRVNEKVVSDVLNGYVQSEHSSNLGVIIAMELSKKMGCPAFFVDPVSIDEFDDVSRLSGLKELPRKSLIHALNTKYVSRKLAEEVGKPYETMNLIVAHLGTGISISASRDGRAIDVNNANDGGPFSPQRAGTLPTTGLIELCFSGKYSKRELLNKVIRFGGLVDYLGTDSLEEVLSRIERGDTEADLVYRAMIYQIAKEIGSMACALKGKVDYIILTGGMSRSPKLQKDVMGYVNWIAPVKVFPGENEMEALAYGVMRVLRGEITPKEYE